MKRRSFLQLVGLTAVATSKPVYSSPMPLQSAAEIGATQKLFVPDEISSEEETYGQLIVAENDGTDTHGNSYLEDDHLIVFPCGRVICVT